MKQDAGDALYRIYTSERITPDLPGMRDLLYPNIQLLHGVQGSTATFRWSPSSRSGCGRARMPGFSTCWECATYSCRRKALRTPRQLFS